jgi:hypothetical protein
MKAGKMSNEEQEYRVLWPHAPIPGCLAVVALSENIPAISNLEEQKQKQIFIVRAVISDHIPLAGGIRQTIEREGKHLVDIEVNPLTIYLHHGGASAEFFDLVPDELQRLKYISVEVVSQNILNALHAARTAINQLLDTMLRRVWLPLVISRLDIHLHNSAAAIAHQVLLPFPTNLRIGSLGGFHQPKAFLPLESLVREAAASSSPFYRFLCSYRLCEGIPPLRHLLKNICNKIGVNERLPKDVLIDKQLLIDLGYRKEFVDKITNLTDLFNNLTNHRNRVAHFLLDKKEKSPPLHLSDGRSYFEYSVGGAILLYYGHRALIDLLLFFNNNLDFKLHRGSVLPMVANRDRFRVIASADEDDVQQ